MSITSKTSSLQSYHMVLYKGAIHPEFFGIEGRRRIEHGPYDFEAWIFKGGHVLRFEHESTCLSEIVTDQHDRLPGRGHVATLPCAGERDHEEEFEKSVLYMTSMQTETLSDHLYLGTFNELYEHGLECGGLSIQWNDELGRPNLSVVDMQRYNTEVHVQGYHLRSDCSLVLRTQSIYQVKKK